MIRLENMDNDLSIPLTLQRGEAALIARALSPGWAFVEKVPIAPATAVQSSTPTVAKPAKPAKQPRPKAEQKAKAEPTADKEVADKRKLYVESVVKTRLANGGGHPKAVSELYGDPLLATEIKAALDTLRATGEVEVVGQKRGTKYCLAGPAYTTTEATE